MACRWGDNERRLRSGLYSVRAAASTPALVIRICVTGHRSPILIAYMEEIGLHDLANLFRSVYEL
jgi:hypothetical protein